MKRWAFLAPAAALGLAWVPAGPWAPRAAGPQEQQEPQEEQVRSVHVGGKVHMLVGRGGNIGVSAGPDGILMIDDQFAQLAEPIQARIEAIAAEQSAPSDLRYVLNTHHHGDHTGGNAFFGARAPIVSHRRVRERLQLQEGTAPEALPEITFEKEIALFVNGERVRVVHYPSCHTDGDSVVFFEGSKVVHLGDLFFRDRFPFVDLDAGGDVERLIAAIEELVTIIREDEQIIPGHGELSRREDLERYLAMLKETRDWARQRLDEGKELRDMQAEGLAAEYESWGSGFIDEDRWVEILVRSLQREE